MNGDKQVTTRPGWLSALKTPFEWLDTGLDWFERTALVVCILAMAAVSVANVLSRNIFGSSLQYANDVAQILLVIVTFMGIGIGARHARHIRVSAIHDLLPHGVQKVLLIIVSFTTAALLFMLAGYGWDYATAAQRSCRVLPEALHVPLAVGAVLTVAALAIVGHLVRIGHDVGSEQLARLSDLMQKVALVLVIIIGLVIASWVFNLFIALVDAREGRCRVMSSTGFPVYLTYMLVPLGFLLGGIQFFLAGLRNLISRDNYLSWHNKDEYDSVEDLSQNTGMAVEDLSTGGNGTPSAGEPDKGGRENG